MILTNRQIEEAYKKGDILIHPYDEVQVQAATYDFRVGEQGATTSTKKIVNIREAGYILLQPGDFGVITVLEEIRLGPQYAARFGLRSKYARKGLIATTGPQIDPGFHGKLIIGVTNLTPKPVSLAYKDDLVSVEFHRLEEPSTKPYCGAYQNKFELGAEEIEFIAENEGMALSEVLTTLRSLSANVGQLSHEVKNMKWTIPIILAVGLALISAIIALKAF
jgi:dCTP deaminase